MRNNVNSEYLKITPSEVRTYTYCPRLFFYETYMSREKSFSEKLRLALGRLYHFILESLIRIRRRGALVEKSIERPLGNILLVGRPDAILPGKDHLQIVEIKSGKAPANGRPWHSDKMQLVAYYMLLSGMVQKEIRTLLRYRDREFFVKITSNDITRFHKILEEIYYVKAYGIFPAAKYSPGKCQRCPYLTYCMIVGFP